MLLPVDGPSDRALDGEGERYLFLLTPGDFDYPRKFPGLVVEFGLIAVVRVDELDLDITRLRNRNLVRNFDRRGTVV